MSPKSDLPLVKFRISSDALTKVSADSMLAQNAEWQDTQYNATTITMTYA